jgi:3-oxoacyl-[acyl-carrier protein] reductase
VNLRLDGCIALVHGRFLRARLARAESRSEEGANVVMFVRRPEPLRREEAGLGATRSSGLLLARNTRARGTQRERHGGSTSMPSTEDVLRPAPLVSDDSLRLTVDRLPPPVVRLVGAAVPTLPSSRQGRITSISSILASEPIRKLALSKAVRPGVWGYLTSVVAEPAADSITPRALSEASLLRRIRAGLLPKFGRERMCVRS